MADTVFRDRVVRLADLVVTADIVADAQFINVEIIGPGILVLNGSVRIENCNFDANGADALLWPIDDDRGEVTGAIGLKNVKFTGCQFRRVGLAALRSDMGVLRSSFGLE